jgi:acyl-coenzyme A synthetase/AMP-(fatty) acid ligase
MNTAVTETRALRDHIADGPAPRFLWDRAGSACFTEIARGSAPHQPMTFTIFGDRPGALAGRSVLLAAARQLTTALALIELDGLARRLLIVPPDIDASYLPVVAAAAEVDAVVIDDGSPQRFRCIDRPGKRKEAEHLDVWLAGAPSIVPADAAASARLRTEWVLVTSGTTGAPKLIAHDLASLIGPVRARTAADGAAVWGTFYDIRRYGGLQIFLRAALGGASMVLSAAGEPMAEHLARLARHGVTHLSGTPSHWRNALMNPAIRGLTPRYVRLSGEIADQAILDRLRAVFPHAAIGHVYASTEAGVAFDVDDGRAGFPAALVGAVRDGVEMKIVDGSLRIRSPRAASRYLGTSQPLADADGFVDTGDMVERRGERFYFTGRKGGIINIGGLKVHPEEIEAVINRHPQVRMALVRSRQSPITGSIVVADVVLEGTPEPARQAEVSDDILKFCREFLPRHKVPAAINVVPALGLGAAGKLARRG